MRFILVLMALAAAERTGTQAQAVLLDQNQFACENCLFGMNDYYFCFEAGDKVLIGHEKVRTQMRHQNPFGLVESGKPVSIRYDDQFIWVVPPGAKEIKLKQDYATKIFLKNKRCQTAAGGVSTPKP